jgi:hypothetical protein
MQNSTNPLAKHFRQPGVYLKLPSEGKYWPSNSISLTATGEIPVMPMTTKDEILLRTPDALMNGQGVVDVIQSCCPNISNAWGMPAIDADAILVAIRIATNGNGMNIDSKCVHCENENRHEIDLSKYLLGIRSPNYSKSYMIDGLKFIFKPINYLQFTKNSLIEFESQKIVDIALNTDLPDDVKKAQFDVQLQNVIKLTHEMITQNTESITTEEGIVVKEFDHILEFYNNAPKNVLKKVQDVIFEINNSVKKQPINVLCEACEKPYEVNVTFDYANFFEDGS